MKRSILYTLLILGFASVVSAQLKTGDLIALECLGDKEGARWLEARPKNQATVLTTEPKQRLGQWRVYVYPSGLVSLRCAAVSKESLLNGDTPNARVSLAPNNKEYTGTRWKVAYGESDVISLECAGDLGGPKFLDGRTVERDAVLSSATENSGTKWRIHFILPATK